MSGQMFMTLRKKRRVPAWCDRVYYRGRDDRIAVEDYGSLAVRVSDHKPVMALCKLRVKTIDPGARQDVYKEACRDGNVI